jgi:hypothetical protein
MRIHDVAVGALPSRRIPLQESIKGASGFMDFNGASAGLSDDDSYRTGDR